MDAAGSNAFLKVNGTLKNSAELLREARIHFPVLKALASADHETRSEAISRIAGGATLGTRDVSTSRANLRNRKMTEAELSVASAFKSSARLAQRRAVDPTRNVDEGSAELLSLFDTHRLKNMIDERGSEGRGRATIDEYDDYHD